MSVITPSFAPDFELCANLHRSVLDYSPKSVHHHIFVPRTDLKLFRQLASPRTHIRCEGDLLPPSFVRLPRSYVTRLTVVKLISLVTIVPLLYFLLGVPGAILGIAIRMPPSAICIFLINRHFRFKPFLSRSGLAWCMAGRVGRSPDFADCSILAFGKRVAASADHGLGAAPAKFGAMMQGSPLASGAIDFRRSKPGGLARGAYLR